MSEPIRYLCFGLGEEEFAIPLLTVKEVMAMPEVTPIPQTPAHFLGIVNLRGSVISVMDLRLKLGIKPSKSEETTVVILDLGEMHMGIAVDRVNSVQALTKDQVSEKPMIDSSKSNDYITGVFRKESHLILLVDISRALSLEDKDVLVKRAA